MLARKFNTVIGASAFAALAFVLDPMSADAGVNNLDGYACQVHSYYSNGSVSASMYTGAGCSGTFIATPSVRNTFFGGAEGYEHAMLPALVSAVANDTRITGTYTTGIFFGSPYTRFDNIHFVAD